MWFGIGQMCLENKYDQNINVPNNSAGTVRCAHFTQIVCVITKPKVNSELSFKCVSNNPHIDSAKMKYNIRMFAGAAVMDRNLRKLFRAGL